MKCTAAEAVKAFEYWMGYYEKASSAYADTREKSAFEKNKGNNNYSYAGYLTGVQGQPWCAAMVSTAFYEACGESRNDAREVMWGLWPYINCGQLWDMAPSNMKGRRGYWNPKPGDVIVFTDNGTTRDHTGLVYAVDGSYVYTMEGNTSQMARKRSYLISSTYIYGYVRPNYRDGALPNVPSEQYGKVVCNDPELHMLSKGCAGPEVKTVQRILYARGIRDDSGAEISVDGDFGKRTEQGVKHLQEKLGIVADGWVWHDTWTKMLTELR